MSSQKATWTYTSNLDSVLRNLDSAVAKGLAETGEAVVATAIQIAPHLSGNLKENIYSESDSSSVTIIANTEYAWYVENGTQFMGAQPYLVPAADQHFPELADRIRSHNG
jgi:HK97 gp10 family phage protein